MALAVWAMALAVWAVAMVASEIWAVASVLAMAATAMAATDMAATARVTMEDTGPLASTEIHSIQPCSRLRAFSQFFSC